MEFSSDNIKIIRGLSTIRRRPDIYFKEKGRNICISLLKDIIASISEPSYHCCASIINIRALQKGGVRIKYDGAGMPSESSIVDGVSHPILYTSILSLSHRDSKEINFRKYGHLTEVGPFLAALSQELTIETIVENKTFSVSFEFGAISSLLSETVQSDLNEIYVVFAPELIKEGDINSLELEQIVSWAKSKFTKTKITID